MGIQRTLQLESGGNKELLIMLVPALILVVVALGFMAYAEACIYYNRQQFPQVLAQLEADAERGQPDALVRLGMMYRNGWHKVQDKVKARQMLEQASALGHQEGTVLLATMLKEGEGGPKDHLAAFRLLEKLCAEYAPAGFYLGLMMIDGVSPEVPCNRERAHRLLAPLARAGSVVAQNALTRLNRG